MPPGGLPAGVMGAPCADASISADALAERLLSQESLSFESCRELLCIAFPAQVANNRPQVLGAKHDVSYFVLGHFHHSPRAGITNLTRSVPAVVRFLNSWLQLLFPSCSWGSIAVSHNVLAAPHADLENSVASQNFTVSLGSFSGGGLWLADESGDIVMQGADGLPVRGVVHPTFQEPFAFDAHRLHATQPFTGDRWSVTAYTNRHLLEVSGIVWDELRALGFPLPQPSAATRSVVLGPNPASVASPLSPPAELQPQEARVVQCEALLSPATAVHPVSYDGPPGSVIGPIAWSGGLSTAPTSRVLLLQNCNSIEHSKELPISDERTAGKQPRIDPADPHTVSNRSVHCAESCSFRPAGSCLSAGPRCCSAAESRSSCGLARRWRSDPGPMG